MAETTLEAVGLSALEARAYEALLQMPDVSPKDLGSRLGLEGAELPAVFEALRAKGLVTSAPEDASRLEPAPPEVAVEALVMQQRDRLEQARLQATQLMGRYRERTRPEVSAELDDIVELVRGPEAVIQRFRQLQLRAERELVVLNKPPYLTPVEQQEQLELELLGRIRVRGLYEREAVESDERLRQLETLMAAGEDARLLPAVPMKLAIADGTLALVPLAPDRPDGGGSALLVRPGGLLDALNLLVEQLWSQAVPAGAPVRPVPRRPAELALNSKDSDVLRLLQLGLPDRTIARRLNVTERTVARRVRNLMDATGVETRFQLGWRAAARGWLPGEDDEGLLARELRRGRSTG